MLKTNPTSMDDLVLSVQVRVASDRKPKLSSDFVLKQEMERFMDDHIDEARIANKTNKNRPRIVLITGDADFVEPALRAVRLGFDVVLLHYGANSSPALVGQWYRREPVEWSSFIANSIGVGPVFSYETEETRKKKAVSSSTV